jgi:hypothetical protein
MLGGPHPLELPSEDTNGLIKVERALADEPLDLSVRPLVLLTPSE